MRNKDDNMLTEDEAVALQRYCLRTSAGPWRSSFFVRFCLLRLEPPLGRRALAATNSHAHAYNECLGFDSFYQNLSTYDLVDAFNGLLFPGLLAPVKRGLRRLWDRIPEAPKFWITVRTGKEAFRLQKV